MKKPPVKNSNPRISIITIVGIMGLTLFLLLYFIFLGLLSVVIVLLVAIVIISYFVLSSKIPEYRGEIAVSGILNEVNIYRDEFGTPFIIAEDDMDAVFALGYVHAQERLFQMDITRRAGMGRTVKILSDFVIETKLVLL